MKLRIKVDGRTKSETLGISLEVQWLTSCTSNEGGTGLIPGQGTKIRRAAQWGLKKKKKKNETEDFPGGPVVPWLGNYNQHSVWPRNLKIK